MSSKCWFVLKQTHYPPPVISKHRAGRVRGSGPVCLGHLIPDLKHLDNVINRHGPLDIPPDMPIYPTKAWDLTWEERRHNEADVSGKGGIPIVAAAAATGVAINLDVGVAFKQTIKNFWDFSSLETIVFQPTNEYVEDSIEDDEVAAYLEKRGFFKSSNLFMITGIIVARGAKRRISESQGRDLRCGPGIEIPTIAEAGVGVSVLKETETSSTAQRTTDFVWAIRLAKITKGFVDRQWTHETVASGATFAVNNEADEADKGRDLVNALRSEGLEMVNGTEVQSDSDIFVVGTDSGEAFGAET